MDDPHVDMEKLDEEALDYVRKCNDEFRSRFGSPPRELIDEIRKYHGSRKVIAVKITRKGILSAYIDEGAYHLAMDEAVLYSTQNLIFWIEADSSGKRTAVFETPGSDRGLLTIMEDGMVKEQMEGAFSGVVFFDESHYAVKTFIDDPPEEGAEVNSHRVMLDGSVVFGSGLGPEDFITLSESNGTAFAVVGDWLKSSVYSGPVARPGLWTKVKQADYPIVPMGIRAGRSYFFEETGPGRITSGDQVIVESDIPLESAVLVEEGILAISLKDAKALPVLYDLEGNLLKEFPMKVPMGLKAIDSDGKDAVLTLESFGIRYSMLRYHGSNIEKLSENRLLDLVVREEWVKSGDVDVHFFRIQKLGADTGKAVVYGYGGFNIPVTPMFFPLFAYLLNHGVTVVVANLRGGGEYGSEWHHAGTREKKQNVFNDFESVIKSMKDAGMEVVAYGVSNGGLLVGAAVTQFPEMLSGAIIGNPVLDMMRFHKMSVGRFWISEFGDPDNKEDAEFLVKYSPYHNIGNRSYPPTLLYTRLKDDRVHPAHAIKFHRALNDKSSVAYLRVNATGGHIGITVEEMVSEISDICIFTLSALKLR